MLVVMKYREEGISQKNQLLKFMNPNITKSGIRTFFVDTDDIGMDNVDEIYAASLREAPNGYELHCVEIPSIDFVKFNEYNTHEQRNSSTFDD